MAVCSDDAGVLVVPLLAGTLGGGGGVGAVATGAQPVTRARQSAIEDTNGPANAFMDALPNGGEPAWCVA